jgi:lysophospholipase L1-like esterase
MVDNFIYANSLIENEIAKYDSNWHFIDIFQSMVDAEGRPKNELFVKDGLHLSEKGYRLWKEIIDNCISVNH